MDAETLARLKLHLVPGLGPKTTEALLARFESAEQVLRTPASLLATVPHVSKKTAEQFVQKLQEIQIETELEWIEKHQARLLHQDHEHYPGCLRDLAGAPLFLYCRGELTEADAQSVAIVGSRHCTPYGKRITTKLAEGLARAGWTIVSGLARGIDGAAHQAALDAGGRTVAVLAGGLGKLYPPEHRELAERITGQGAVLSEMPMQMAPMPDLFPRRNRIISGMSRAVIIVEAALRSGALITARLAAEQGREVFAVPGPVDSEASEGTHQLIRQGAALIRSADDVLEALGALALPRSESQPGEAAAPAAAMIPQQPPSNLSPIQLQVWQALGVEGAAIDDLVQSAALGISEVNSALFMMELAGHIRRSPGNRFARK
jgi:DNA processing protein